MEVQALLLPVQVQKVQHLARHLPRPGHQVLIADFQQRAPGQLLPVLYQAAVLQVVVPGIQQIVGLGLGCLHGLEIQGQAIVQRLPAADEKPRVGIQGMQQADTEEVVGALVDDPGPTVKGLRQVIQVPAPQRNQGRGRKGGQRPGERCQFTLEEIDLPAGRQRAVAGQYLFQQGGAGTEHAADKHQRLLRNRRYGLQPVTVAVPDKLIDQLFLALATVAAGALPAEQVGLAVVVKGPVVVPAVVMGLAQRVQQFLPVDRGQVLVAQDPFNLANDRRDRVGYALAIGDMREGAGVARFALQDAVEEAQGLGPIALFFPQLRQIVQRGDILGIVRQRGLQCCQRQLVPLPRGVDDADIVVHFLRAGNVARQASLVLLQGFLAAANAF